MGIMMTLTNAGKLSKANEAEQKWQWHPLLSNTVYMYFLSFNNQIKSIFKKQNSSE